VKPLKHRWILVLLPVVVSPGTAGAQIAPITDAGQPPSQHYALRTGRYASQPVRYYDFGPANPEPSSLYRLSDGSVVFSSVPGLPNYSPLRVVYNVRFVGDPAATPHSADTILTMVREGKARLSATGVIVNVPVVPAGSTLEDDPEHRELLAGWFHDRPVAYFDFGRTRAAAMAAGSDGTTIASVPGSADYSDVWAIQAAPTGQKQRNLQNRPVVYAAGAPAHRVPSSLRDVPAPIAATPPVGGTPRAATTPVSPGKAPSGPTPARAVATPVPSSASATPAPPAPPEGGTMIASGISGQTTVAARRIEGALAEVVVDGVLDEPVWKQAALLTGFSEYQPADGRPAEDSTEVLVWYSSTAIYFGIRAFEPHGSVHATLATRDHIQADDNVQILLDTFNGRRQAATFGVNALGVQSDGTLTEGLQQRNAGISASAAAQSARDTVDLSADFVYQSKGHLTDYGYEVEIRIPFKTLRFQPIDVQSWGINVIRLVQHSGHEDSWAPAHRAASSFLGQSGTLSNLHGLSRGLVLDLNPEVTSKVNGAPPATAAPGWGYDWAKPRFGGNVRWGVSNGVTLNGTINPDFSQIEADIQQVLYDPRSSPFYPEKRPFFLDGIELFQAPNNLIYTRRLISPVGALKLSGNLSGANFALLSGADDKSYSLSGSDHPVYNMFRARRNVGPQSSLGLVYTDRIEGSTFNRVAALDSRVVFAHIYDFSLQGAASATGDGTTTTYGPLWWMTFNRNGHNFAMHYSQTGISPKFNTESGFISRGSIVSTSLAHVFTFYGKPHSILESWSYNLTLNGVWSYHHYVGGDLPDEPKFHNTVQFTFKGGWRLGGFAYLESFNYDSTLFASYYLQRRLPSGVVDTIPYGTGAGRIRNIDLGINFSTPQFARYGVSANLLAGPDDNFFEWSQALIWFVGINGYWYPTNRLRVTAQYNEQRYLRWDDRTLVSLHRIPYLKVEYQLTRAVFLRFVGQYDARLQDSLRDDSRTNFPILIRSGNTYTRAGASVSNRFMLNWLFSYQPVPGTVFFAGYGSNLTESDAFTFRDLHRTTDGFFVKLTYLFRL
jgi:hypothetical protein